MNRPAGCGPENESNGNVLFLILLAVILFAALSYAVTSSTRGGGDTGDTEKDALIAAQLSQYIGEINAALMRFNLSGVSWSAMKFHAGPNGDCGSGFTAGRTPTLCITGDDCVFSPTGGALSLWLLPPKAFKAVNKGVALPGQRDTAEKTNIWIDCNEDLFDWGLGTSAPDRTFYLLNVAQGVCRAYNKALGVNGIPYEDAGVEPSGTETTLCYKQTEPPNAGDYEIFDILYVQ